MQINQSHSNFFNLADLAPINSPLPRIMDIHVIFFPLYSKKMTKSHNSCKTCNIAKSNLYGHLLVILVSVCGYEIKSIFNIKSMFNSIVQ